MQLCRLLPGCTSTSARASAHSTSWDIPLQPALTVQQTKWTSGTQLVSPVKVEKCFCVNSSWCNNMTASHADRFRQVHRGCDAIHQLLQGLHSFLPALHLNSSTRPETSTELNCHTPIHCTWPSILLIRSSPTHPCRQTAPLSWSTARWAGCSSPPCPPAEPYHR